MSERTLLITADGTQYDLDIPPTRNIISEEGLGLPPIDYVSQRGPYQHGETVRDYFLKPRAFQYVIRHNYCDRGAYWAGRQALLNIVRPNRGGNPGLLTLRRMIPDIKGKLITRDMQCVIDAGPGFAPRKQGEWDELAYTEVLKGTAYNPVWFDPVSHSVVYVPTVIPTFPISFPVEFIGFSLTANLNYVGSWIEYPTITVNGPCGEFAIINNTTGESIGMNYPIPVGRSITINLGYGLKTVLLDNGSNLIGYVTPGSNLATFHLEPGANNLTIQGVTGIAITTQVRVTYFDRYIGI